ncbi:hypothetical protein ACOK4R_32945 (plasmid) [Pseudomonas fluorescens]|nr:hypothetical protein [Pseudomonas fluorescens]
MKAKRIQALRVVVCVALFALVSFAPWDKSATPSALNQFAIRSQ